MTKTTYPCAANSFFVDEDYDAAIEQYTTAIELAFPVTADLYIKRSNAFAKSVRCVEAISDLKKAVDLEPSNKIAWKKLSAVYKSMDELESAQDALEKSKNADSRANTETAKRIDPTREENAKKIDTICINRVDCIRHEWFQSLSYVSVCLFAKNLKEEECTIKFDSHTLFVKIDRQGYEKQFELFDEIDASQCKFELFGTKVEIKMLKKARKNWDALEKTDAPKHSFAVVSDSTTTDSKVYPTSSRKKTNWDALETEIKKETKEEKVGGDAGTNKLFQQIYGDADEDSRRAMMKSYYESGGTVLSTNWKDIGAKKTEVSPPDNMKYEKW